MKFDDKIRDEKLQYGINSVKKYQHCHQVQLIKMNTLQRKKYYLLIKVE